MRQVATPEDDPRTLPAYTVGEAAHYLQVPKATLRSWVAGRPYQTRRGEKRAAPVIKLASHQPPTLSFVNLIEAHVLAAVTRAYRIPLPRVRTAVGYLRREASDEHPLANQAMETDLKDLFIRRSGLLINVSREGQSAIVEILDTYLERIERDLRGLPIRLYPFTRGSGLRDLRAVVIDPRISFGKPVLVGTNIPTSIVAERYKAGETIKELATDYIRRAEEIEEAIRCELELRAA